MHCLVLLYVYSFSLCLLYIIIMFSRCRLSHLIRCIQLLEPVRRRNSVNIKFETDKQMIRVPRASWIIDLSVSILSSEFSKQIQSKFVSEVSSVFLFNYHFDGKHNNNIFDKRNPRKWERMEEVTNVSVRFTFHITFIR